MDTFEKYHIFSIQQQKLCIEAYINENKQINFKAQNIYKHNRSFKLAMQDLIKINIFKLKISKTFPFYNIYYLTLDGILFVEGVLRK